MSAWDGLIVGARWKCGHPKTPENTQSGHRQGGRCKICHRQRGRDYWERCRFEAAERAGRVLEEDPRAELLGGEFTQARKRFKTKAASFIRRISS